MSLIPAMCRRSRGGVLLGSQTTNLGARDRGGSDADGPRRTTLWMMGLLVAVLAGAASRASAQEVRFPEDGIIIFEGTDDDEIMKISTDVVKAGKVPPEDGQGEPTPDEDTPFYNILYSNANAVDLGGAPLPADYVPVFIVCEFTIDNTDPDNPVVVTTDNRTYDWQVSICSQATFDAVTNAKKYVLLGLGGTDVLDGSILPAEIALNAYGGDGNDLILGGAGDDATEDPNTWGLDGGPGDDIILGGGGDDEINGRSGNDILTGNAGDDIIAGGGGYDILDYRVDGGPGGCTVALGTPGSATDTAGDNDEIWGFTVVLGSDNPDTLTAYPDRGGSVLMGRGENDVLNGGPFMDFLFGDTGDDTINGGNDPDYLFGGGGDDVIDGGTDNARDMIFGEGDDWDSDPDGPEDTTLAKDGILDFLRYQDHPLDPAYQVFDPHNDPDADPPQDGLGGILQIQTLLLNYAAPTELKTRFLLPATDIDFTGNDTITGGPGADLIAGGAGDDFIDGGDHADIIFGDRVVNRPLAITSGGLWGPWNPVVIPPGTDPATYDSIIDDVETPMYGSDQIKGGAGADIILGGNGDDQINGDDDGDIIYGDIYFNNDAAYVTIRDRILGLAQNDRIRGGASIDYIFGGPGDDALVGDVGADVFQGNQGADVIVGCGVILGNLVACNDDCTNNDRDLLNSFSPIPYYDTDPFDTVDYHMVPPAADGGMGADIDLGADNPGGAFTLGYAIDGEPMPLTGSPSTDILFAIENAIGTRHDDFIKGTTRSDNSLLTGRDFNNQVFDCFRRSRFPSDSGSVYDVTSHAISRTWLTVAWDGRVRYGFDNILLGLDGDDVIIGRRGEDALCGGYGDDKIWGDGKEQQNAPPPDVLDPDDPSTSGNDEIWGDMGNDDLYGEWGDDVIHGGLGVDFMSGGSGTDMLAFNQPYDGTGVLVNLTNASIDLKDWDALYNTYKSVGWPVSPLIEVMPITGLPAATVTVPDDQDIYNRLTMTFTNGTILPAYDYDPTDVVNHRGFGTAYVAGSYDVIVNRYPPDPLAVDPATGDTFNPDRFEVVYGSTAADLVYGHADAPNILYGEEPAYGGTALGNDILVGGAADDKIYGEGGHDILEGRGGDDYLQGSRAPATPPGVQFDTDNDWISYNDVAGGLGVVVNLAETEPQNTRAGGRDTLVDVENVLGSQYGDVITGNARANILLGAGGEDILNGRSDQDILQNNRTHITSDILVGGPGDNDTVDYRLGDPDIVEASAAKLTCIDTDDPTLKCAMMSNDGEGGSDQLLSMENILTPDDGLVVGSPTIKTIAPGEAVALQYTALGGNGYYAAEFDPTTDMKARKKADGTPLPAIEVAILAAPADQDNPASPFVVDQDLAAYKAVRTLEGTPSAAGFWQFVVYARPLETTEFVVTIIDKQDQGGGTSADRPAPKRVSRPVKVVVTEPLEVLVEQDNYAITSGDEVQLRATITGGAAPYKITWTASDGSEGTTLSRADILIPVADPTVTTEYTITVEDTTPDSANQIATDTTTVTVLSTGSTTNSGTTTNTGGSSNTGGSGTTSDTTNSGANQPGEVSGADQPESTSTTTAAPLCGLGMSSSMVLANLLVLAVMKRRRW